MIDIGPFRLIDPPPGQAEIIRAAYDAINYPWDRLTPELSADPDGACLVKWVDSLPQGTTGRFRGSYEIHLSTGLTQRGQSAGLVFTHEVGHLVDRATFDTETRDRLMALLHASPETYRDDAKGQTHNGNWWPDSHMNPHSELWLNGGARYNLQIHEAYADLFVRAFAPTVWDGSYLEGAPSRSATWVRFVHWTDDLAAVRDLTLARDMTPAPPAPEPEPEPVEPPETEGPDDMSNAGLTRPRWRGRTNVDRMTIDAIEEAEHAGGHPFIVTQGSYQRGHGDENSAGTHDGGGAVDLRWCGHRRCIAALRGAGFAAWHRTPRQGPWPHHVHAVLIGHPLLARSAHNQVVDYQEGRNGLASNGPDDGPEPLDLQEDEVKRPTTFNGWMQLAATALREGRSMTEHRRKIWTINVVLAAMRAVPHWKESDR